MDDLAPIGASMAAQYRAARALVGWSLIEASRRARVSVSVIAAIERERTPPCSDRCRAIVAAYAEAGIEFHRDGDAFGVTLKPPARMPARRHWSIGP